MMSAELKGFATLLSETWEKFKARALTILGVLVVGSLVVLGGITLTGIVAARFIGDLQTVLQQVQLGQAGVQLFSIIGIFVLMSTILGMWVQSATVAVVVDDTMGVREALRVGWQRLWSMGWILVLAGSIIMTGFLLFMVPGIFFSISLMFVLYPLYDEDLRGMDAIVASRRYVKGRWWNTFGKIVLIWLIAIVLNLVPLIGPFLYFIFTPFLLLFLVAMYRNLKETADKVTGEERRVGLWLLAIIGMVLPVAGMIAALVSLGPQVPLLLQQTEIQVDRRSVPVKPNSVQLPPETSEKTGNGKMSTSVVSPQGIWRDPVGDVAEFGVGRWMDIESVTVKGSAGILLINVQTHSPLTVAFNAASTTAQSFYRLATLYFDTDVNRQTGGPAGTESSRTGYDYGLDLTLEAPRNEPENGQVHVSLFRLENGVRIFLGPLQEGQVQVQGDQIRLRVPYEMLGVQAGNRIRMSFIENFQKQGSGLSKDKLVTL